MGEVTTNILKSTGQLSTQDEGVSGLMFDMSDANLTSYLTPYEGSFTTSDRVKLILSPTMAESFGINDKHTDETKATGGKFVFTATQTTGYVINCYIEPTFGNRVDLCRYVVTANDTTKQLLCQSVADAINANTNTHGYTAGTATLSGSDYGTTLVAPSKMGKSIHAGLSASVRNSNGVTVTSNITVTQFSGGIGSEIAVLHYHIKQAFEKNPNIKLYVGIYDNASVTTAEKWDADRLQDMQDYAGGTIWQFASYTKLGVGTAGANIISQVSEHEYVYEQMGINYSQYGFGILTMDTVTDINTLAKTATLASTVNLRTAVARNVTFDFGGSFRSTKAKRDGTKASTLEYLTGVTGRTIGTCGAWLGIRSRVKCNVSVAETATCNMTGNGEFLEGGTSNGFSWSAINAYSKNLLSLLTSNGYLFCKEYPGYSGVYFCTDQNCDAPSSDYAESKSVKTIYKAARLSYVNSIPIVESQLSKDIDTGLLTSTSMAKIASPALDVLRAMAAAGEISADANGSIPEKSVVVNATIVNGKVTETVKIVQTETLKTLEINLGYVKKL